MNLFFIQKVLDQSVDVIVAPGWQQLHLWLWRRLCPFRSSRLLTFLFFSWRFSFCLFIFAFLTLSFRLRRCFCLLFSCFWVCFSSFLWCITWLHFGFFWLFRIFFFWFFFILISRALFYFGRFLGTFFWTLRSFFRISIQLLCWPFNFILLFRWLCSAFRFWWRFGRWWCSDSLRSSIVESDHRHLFQMAFTLKKMYPNWLQH